MVKKERHRYVLFKFISEGLIKIDTTKILNSIWRSIWKYFGLKEASKVGLWLLDFNQEKNIGILRISHDTKEMILTCLTLIKEIDNNRVIFSPIKTSGTINKIKKQIVNFNSD